MPTLSGDVLAQYRALSRYNSPFDAHDHGCAIDLYPGGERAPSPVGGEVVDTRTVRAPPKPYAEDDDHLILVDTGPYVARVLHVDPAVTPGERVAVGDDLGRLVRAGFFAPWVDNHIHLGFRRHDQNAYRAAGSLPVGIDAAVEALPWDGTGTVVEAGETYVVLDTPAHPAPGEHWVAIASDQGPALDGGLVHYRGGGCVPARAGPLSLLGERVGVATPRTAGGGRATGSGSGSDAGVGEVDGSDVAWADIAVFANDERVTGLSLFASRVDFGAKVICPGHSFEIGDPVEVSLAPAATPVRLGQR